MNVILEGAHVEQRNYKGGVIMPGWRHYRCIFGGRVANTIGLPITGEIAARNFKAKLYRRGEWEIEGTEQPGAFALMRPEIAAEIEGGLLPIDTRANR